MTHMVIFRSPEGKPGYHQAEGLDEAMRFAEMLRNQEQVTDARIFRMDEVPIEFKTYYRVEIGVFPTEVDEVDLDEGTHLSAIDGGLDDLSEQPSTTSSRFGLFGRS